MELPRPLPPQTEISRWNHGNHWVCGRHEIYIITLIKGYNLTKDGHHALLPNNVSELNHYMCGPLNRKDYICSECKGGYGPTIISELAYVVKCYFVKIPIYIFSSFQSLCLSSHSHISSQADLCPDDMLHHVRSTDHDGILWRVCTWPSWMKFTEGHAGTKILLTMLYSACA